jgi:Bacteriocin-protection, YdeI or OmpD-Associated
MAESPSKKLRIKEKTIILPVNAPSNFKKSLGTLPAGAKLIQTGENYNQVHWFVMNRAQMERDLKKVLNLIKRDAICWIYYPKMTSGIQTDLNRDKGWDALLKHDTLTWINLVSFDDTWSAFGFRLKTDADKKKKAKPNERPIFSYVDPVSKTVRLPEDLATLLKNNKKQAEFFNSLSFTNKKEYIEWIVNAKRAETRNERIKGTVERLGKEWKNPRNM